MARASLWLIGITLAGCGPSLRDVVREQRAFSPTERCSQGPFELETRLRGEKWGEGVRVWACAPHALRGHSELFLDGRKEATATFETEARYDSTTNDYVTPPGNERCVARPEEVASIGEGGSASAARGSAGGRSHGRAAGAAKAEEVAKAPLLVEAADDPCPYTRTDIAGWSSYTTSPDGSPFGAVEVRVVIWSEQPNDLEGARFHLERFAEVPSVSDEKWAQHLREEEKKDAAENAKLVRECEKHPEKCRPSSPSEDKPVARTGPDGPPPPPRAEAKPPSPSAHAEWIPGRWLWARGEWTWIAGLWRVPDEDRASGQTAIAPAPPPAARVEAMGGAPLPGMVWVPGGWMWSGRWVWVAGSWQMPPPNARWRPSRWIVDGGRVRLDPGGWMR